MYKEGLGWYENKCLTHCGVSGGGFLQNDCQSASTRENCRFTTMSKIACIQNIMIYVNTNHKGKIQYCTLNGQHTFPQIYVYLNINVSAKILCKKS